MEKLVWFLPTSSLEWELPTEEDDKKTPEELRLTTVIPIEEWNKTSASLTSAHVLWLAIHYIPNLKEMSYAEFADENGNREGLYVGPPHNVACRVVREGKGKVKRAHWDEPDDWVSNENLESLMRLHGCVWVKPEKSPGK